MDSVNWTPLGTDGVQANGKPIPTDGETQCMELGVQTFRAMVLAIYDNDMNGGQAEWETLCDSVQEDVNPYGIVCQVGIVLSAMAVRALAGDTNPTGPPQGQMGITSVAWDRSNGSIVDSPVSDVAVEAISYAANWDWDHLTAMMEKRLDEQENATLFLHELAGVLMSIFIGVGGIERVGWR